ncbi:MAG: hypothetical protein PWQ15_231 [Methanobacterium sp.]|uniref:DUF515 domain-containing protein n=1 Tax=Methanobacterium sp. TaxID=2164 RepID=UPI0003C9C6AD|nr:DUF515 domain-containing protein [Methanobacterium sp.]MDI3549129.1 hypothetical protein [Methanobacterium sp.]CDG64329.1 hypothetical protein MBMB1_0211 [Methanobacterium sp. MB1]
MLDKILGKKDKDKKDVPDLRKDGKQADSDIGGRLKGMVSKATEKSKEIANNNKENGKPSAGDKRSRSMPKPRPISRPSAQDKPTLKPPLKKQPPKKGRFGGLGSAAGFGKGGIPNDDDQRTLIGAAVFGIILIILVGAGYYFMVYAPYQESLTAAKQTKITEVDTYFKGALATDYNRTLLLAEIDGAATPEEALSVDVLGPATSSWRHYQSEQIKSQKDPYGRVMISYEADGEKNLLMKTEEAQTIVNEADAKALSNMLIETPDTVAVPIIISRVQAAGGLVNVGDSVDVYLTNNASQDTPPANTSDNNTTEQTGTETLSQPSSLPTVSGATVLAILRASGSGDISAQLAKSKDIAKTTLTMTGSRTSGKSSTSTQTVDTQVEELLKAASSNTWNPKQVNRLLNSYGWRLSDFERASNLGELDVQYMVVLEVPRENALAVIQNSQSLQLIVPTQDAPKWMITELQRIYGTG